MSAQTTEWFYLLIGVYITELLGTLGALTIIVPQRWRTIRDSQRHGLDGSQLTYPVYELRTLIGLWVLGVTWLIGGALTAVSTTQPGPERIQITSWSVWVLATIDLGTTAFLYCAANIARGSRKLAQPGITGANYASCGPSAPD